MEERPASLEPAPFWKWAGDLSISQERHPSHLLQGTHPLAHRSSFTPEPATFSQSLSLQPELILSTFLFIPCFPKQPQESSGSCSALVCLETMVCDTSRDFMRHTSCFQDPGLGGLFVRTSTLCLLSSCLETTKPMHTFNATVNKHQY